MFLGIHVKCRNVESIECMEGTSSLVSKRQISKAFALPLNRAAPSTNSMSLEYWIAPDQANSLPRHIVSADCGVAFLLLKF
jgi:hypothetical protein